MSRINMPYVTYFNRWPEPDKSVEEKLLMDHWSEIWRHYRDILDNGRGIQALQALQAQIEKEINQVENEIDQFPKVEEAEFGFLFSKENAKERLRYSRIQLEIREHIIRSVITHFAVNGKVHDEPPEIQELTEIQEMALDIVCQNADRIDKRDILKEYLILSKSKVKKEIRDLFKGKYQLKQPTFYQWTRALNDEMKRISRTGK